LNLSDSFTVRRFYLIGKRRWSLPILRQEIQGAAAARHAERLALEPKLARPRICLRFTQGIAFERLATLLFDLLGLDLNEGRLSTCATRRGFLSRRRPPRSARAFIGGTIPQSHETGLRFGKKNWWLWVFHHDDSAFFVPAPSRAKKVKKVGENFLGDLVSDPYGGPMGWARLDNQVCLAHLIRDLPYAIDAGDDIFAPELRHLLCHACRIGRRRRDPENYAARLNGGLEEPMHLCGAKTNTCAWSGRF